MHNKLHPKSSGMKEKLKQSATVMTLDAGGTNFVFSAIRDAEEIVKPITRASNADNLNKSLDTIIKGFEAVFDAVGKSAQAISFAFPGPADYASGIIGDLGNLPAFRGGVALGPMLEDYFNIPVFINNDGDLFAYGEASFGLLPQLNDRLKRLGSHKQFSNLFGLTLGTGFGGGLVRNNELWLGDNGAGAEVWLMRNPLKNNMFAEENLSARAIVNSYMHLSGSNGNELHTPKSIYEIATGHKPGNSSAAQQTFDILGESLGLVIAELITITDACIVIGGGVANAAPLFIKKTMETINGFYESDRGIKVNRLESKAIDLTNEAALNSVLENAEKEIKVPYSNRRVTYNPVKWVGVGTSVLGTSKAVALGAYAFALNKLAKKVLSE